MTDEEKKAAEAAAVKEGLTLNELSPSELIEIIRQTRSEAKEKRLLNKELSERIAEIDKAKLLEEQKKLEEEGKFKELLTAKEIEIENLNKTLKPKAEEYDKFRQEEIEQVKKILGDKWDDEFSNLSLPALRKMAVTLSKKPEPNLDGGSNGANGGGKELTADQKREAYEKFPLMDKSKAEENWKYVLQKTGKLK
jgi:DNA gyrase/topoisomerase IV subunit A